MLMDADPTMSCSSSHCEPYDALLLVSFGGPEGLEDVLPFLENVVRGKNVPRERLLEVSRHYERFDGVSPLNAENRALLAALIDQLNAHGPRMPVYWGNRHWRPMLADAIGQMAEDGVRRALALVCSAFGSYPGCRQYVEAIELARQEVGPSAPTVHKLRLFYNHPGFIESMADRVAAAFEEIPHERRSAARLIYTAHSIPTSMAQNSPYEHQLREACRLVTERLTPLAASHGDLPFPCSKGPVGANISAWDLVFQSRSGPPSQPWLGPDIREHLRRLRAEEKVKNVVIAPIGFLAENMEVVYDLDVEVSELCEQLQINMVRAAVVGNHPRFVGMIRELISERLDPAAPRLSLGSDGPWPDFCPSDCCPPK
jgi:protoporphyrin/coproporphyrin ferrochelatase